MRISVIEPIGFCSGVRRAVDLFKQILKTRSERPIYVLHELVHNRSVSEQMKRQGACFVEHISEVPNGSVILLGAHGCGLDVEEECKSRNLVVFDAVCPLVKQLQKTASNYKTDLPLVLLGDKSHPEVQSVINRAQGRQIFVVEHENDALPRLDAALLLSQTTRNAAEVERVRAKLEQCVGSLESRANVCNAVLLRQKAVEELSRQCDLMLIIGSRHSANATRLLEIASANTRAFMVEKADDIQPQWLENVRHVGVGAGTSTPDSDIKEVLEKLK